jgi:hypothetical protein
LDWQISRLTKSHTRLAIAGHVFLGKQEGLPPTGILLKLNKL